MNMSKIERGEGSNVEPGESFKSSLIILAKGKPGNKIIENRTVQAVPTMGIVLSESPHLVKGLIYPERVGRRSIRALYGSSPNNLIQSWRAIKILEGIDFTYDSTISDAYDIAGGALSRESKARLPYIDRLHAPQLEENAGRPIFSEFVASVLDQVPNEDELNQMIRTSRDNGLILNGWELQDEVKAGRLAPNPLIDKVVEESERKRQEYLNSEEYLSMQKRIAEYSKI